MNKTKELQKEIEELEQNHLNFCGYKASECGCCYQEYEELNKQLKKEKEE